MPVPVMVGAAAVVQHTGGVDPGLEPVALMVEAAHRAATAAGVPGLLAEVGLVAVPRGTWRYTDAGRLVTDALGAKGAQTLSAEIGVLQTTVLSAAIEEVAAGRVGVALVVGGEALDRRRVARRAGRRAEETAQPDAAPDVVLRPEVGFGSEDETRWGLDEPYVQYALIDSARRHRLGIGVDEHRRQVAELWSGFSTVAAANPEAWERRVWGADELLDEEAGGNRMLAFPYTARQVTQMHVDQAAAVLVCSTEVADRTGVPRSSRVFPRMTVDCGLAVPLVERTDPGSCPQWAVVGAALEAERGAPLATVDLLDLYSCFPVAVEVQRDELRLAGRTDLTVTGGMTFGGGPLNNAFLQAVARTWDLLRVRAGADALVTAVSGLLSKQGALLIGTTPPPVAYRRVDVTAAAAPHVDRRPTVGIHRGPAVVQATTVVVPRDGPPVALALCATPDGRGTVGRSSDADLVRSFRHDDVVGATVELESGRILSTSSFQPGSLS